MITSCIDFFFKPRILRISRIFCCALRLFLNHEFHEFHEFLLRADIFFNHRFHRLLRFLLRFDIAITLIIMDFSDFSCALAICVIKINLVNPS